MKFFKEQIRIPDYAWLYNGHEKRTFCTIGKLYDGADENFRIKSFILLEVGSNTPTTIPYEIIEKLIKSEALIIL